MNIDISFHKPKQHFLKVLLGFSICFICNKVQSQHNLVLNPSFEQYTICPTKMNAPPPPPWYLAGTYIPLCYANSCSPDTFRSVPNNYIKTKNFQYARTGNAYVFADYLYPGRQYFQTRLTDSLRTNRYYYAEHFVNIPNGLRLSCNNVGMLFTKTAVYVDTVAEKYGVLPANPQIVNYGNPTLGDTVNWVKVSGVFKALGGEQYLTLGNFKQDSNTILKQIQPTGSYSAGYVIDDVSVIPLDSFCLKADAGRDATITIGDSVFIGSYTNGIDTIKWFNSSGQLIDTVQPGFWVKPTSTGTSFYVLQQTVNGCYTSDTIYVNVVLPLRMMSYELRI
ncbi:MAG: hypothetical protein NTZ59_10600, partial [Bacteroidetes bacterium]|nr:hypothetical protein [Bacteroidota bacterium]